MPILLRILGDCIMAALFIQSTVVTEGLLYAGTILSPRDTRLNTAEEVPALPSFYPVSALCTCGTAEPETGASGFAQAAWVVSKGPGLGPGLMLQLQLLHPASVSRCFLSSPACPHLTPTPHLRTQPCRVLAPTQPRATAQKRHLCFLS